MYKEAEHVLSQVLGSDPNEGMRMIFSDEMFSLVTGSEEEGTLEVVIAASSFEEFIALVSELI